MSFIFWHSSLSKKPELIFGHFCLANKPELDLFTNHSTEAAVEDGFNVEFLPTTSVDDYGPPKFSISGDFNNYVCRM